MKHKKLNRLLPIKFDHRDKKSQAYWLYKCSCGVEKVIRKCSVDSEDTKSCGCLQRELARVHMKINGDLAFKVNTIHGESSTKGRKSEAGGGTSRKGRTREYIVWYNIKYRCLNPNSEHYKDYGGRGITMYGPWIYSYESFRDWLVTNIGRCPGSRYSLDRINNNGNYEPGNLRWATRSQQQKNRRFELRTTNPEEIQLVLNFRQEKAERVPLR